MSPASAAVGTSGRSGLRFGSMVASARSRPSFTCGSAVPGVANAICTRPPRRSMVSGASPLYGTCTMSSFSMVFSCAVVMMLKLFPVP